MRRDRWDDEKTQREAAAKLKKSIEEKKKNKIAVVCFRDGCRFIKYVDKFESKED